jgi:pimeloyl-ACP methyl ester carboxylesterase
VEKLVSMQDVVVDLFAAQASRAMVPIAIEQPTPGDGGACFGWLHPAAGRVAAVLCPGFNADALTGHRSLRQLADTLAAAGYPTLRFDHAGTGDSADAEDAGAEYWSVWQRGVHAAIDRVRAITGAERVVLIGVRLGATLAATVAESRADVAALVLLAPVLRGQTYLRQLAIERRLQGHEPAEGGLEFHEMRLSAATVRRIAEIELRGVRPPTLCRVAVFNPAPSRALTECLRGWQMRGVDATAQDFAGLDPFLRPTFMSHGPNAAPAGLLDWLRRAAPSDAALSGTTMADVAWPPPDPAGETMRHGPCTEQVLRFGPGQHLVGMLCRPETAPETDTALLILNSGGAPRYALGRQAVEFARHLAAAGTASLRFDLAGLGDSTAPGADPEAATHIFQTDRTADIGAALDALERRGYRRFAVLGMCSGAHSALHAAAADPRIGVALLVNLPLFVWRDGDAVERIRAPGPAHYLRRARHVDSWRRALRGKVRPLRAIDWLRRAAPHSFQRIIALARAMTGIRPAATPARRVMETLAARQVRTLLLYAAEDLGVPVLEQEFGPGGAAVPGATVRLLPGLDHSLTTGRMRRAVEAEAMAFLNHAFALPATPAQPPSDAPAAVAASTSVAA